MSTMTRRRLLTLAAGTVATAACYRGPAPARAAKDAPVTLRAVKRVLEVNGKPAQVYGIMQASGAMGHVGTRGEQFRVALLNELDRETLIHWHGLTPPSEQDGVPGLSQPPLKPGARYDYDFPHKRSGTFWMHSHLGLQKQQLLAAPLIVHDPAEAGVDEQEVVVLLHDFSFRAPEEIFDALRGDAAMAMSSHADGSHAGAAQHGEAASGGAMKMSHGHDGATAKEQSMAMSHGHESGMVHYNDVEYDAYLANDRTLADPEVVRVEAGGRVRLRIINAAAATNFLIDLGAIEGELVAVDGNPNLPIRGRAFDLASAQRLDIRLTLPAGQGAYPVLALREDGRSRTGIVLATKDAAVSRLAESAEHKTRPLDLELERRLAALTPLAERIAERSHVVDLTGSHAAFDWGLNEKAYDPDDPLFVAEGERVEIILRNKTAMPHPIHLHGHHFQVVAIDGKRFSGAVRDTVLVPPARAVTIAFDADNPGHWAFHCHQLYHMAAGMMTSVRYEGYRRS